MAYTRDDFNLYDSQDDANDTSCNGDILSAIDASSTIISPVRRGRWLEIPDIDGDSHWQCSVCGVEWEFIADGPVENDARYCPRCGAVMRPDEEGTNIEVWAVADMEAVERVLERLGQEGKQ